MPPEQRAMTQAERDRLARETHERVRKIEVMLTGNGSPEKGVLWRLTGLERQASVIKRLMWAGAIGFATAAGAGVWTGVSLVTRAQAAQARAEEGGRP